MTANKKYYINKNDSIIVNCQECKKTRVVAVGILRNKKHTVKVKCSCGNLFSIDIEFRRFYRKETSIIGCYWNNDSSRYSLDLDSLDRSIACLIVNLSLGGISFKITDNPSLKLNDHLIINFKLDDKEKNEIERSIQVLHIDHINGIVGGEFLPTKIGSYDKYIYFYLK